MGRVLYYCFEESMTDSLEGDFAAKNFSWHYLHAVQRHRDRPHSQSHGCGPIQPILVKRAQVVLGETLGSTCLRKTCREYSVAPSSIALHPGIEQKTDARTEYSNRYLRW